jgi:hypothetical protein
VLERHLSRRQQADDVHQEPSGHHHCAFVLDLRLEAHPQRDFHIGRREEELPVACTQHDACEDLHARPRRDAAPDDLKLVRELVSSAGDLHACPNNSLCGSQFKEKP